MQRSLKAKMLGGFRMETGKDHLSLFYYRNGDTALDIKVRIPRFGLRRVRQSDRRRAPLLSNLAPSSPW